VQKTKYLSSRRQEMISRSWQVNRTVDNDADCGNIKLNYRR